MRRFSASFGGPLPIKIVYIIGTLEVGGAEKHLVELITRLDQTSFEPKVYCLSKGGPLRDVLASRGIEVKVFSLRGLKGLDLVSAIPVVLRLWRSLLADRPAIVHTYLFWANVIGGLLSRLSGVPILITSRRSLGFFKDGKPHYQRLENLVNTWTTVVTVNSKGVLQDVLSREKIEPEKIRLIYNGVDTQKFAQDGSGQKVRSEIGISLDTPVVGCIANLIPYKGHKDLLQAMQIVLTEYPKTKLLLVGRNDRDYYRELSSLALQLGVAGAVVYAGPRTDIVDVLSAIDILVLPSHEEGFSNVILEGMAAGKPLVVTDVGGNPEAVIGGETGLVVPPRSPENLAKAINQLLVNANLRTAFGIKSQERAKRYFSISQTVSSFEQLYLQLLKSKSVKD